jgi:hypothetical protein
LPPNLDLLLGVYEALTISPEISDRPEILPEISGAVLEVSDYLL